MIQRIVLYFVGGIIYSHVGFRLAERATVSY